ncbi:MAG: LysM peptidoglycan-binding domain-containing protein [Deltaproteobacteria bacterium]|nr:LysM peptidoglycan-binding domain-containing protein [Deltaproteobacteria bacterium]
MPLVKATIEILDSDAVDEGRGLPSVITVQFNPTEYSLDKSAQIAEVGIPGIDSPILQFVRGQNEKLTMELFFDTTEQGMGDAATDVRTLTRSIYQLVKIQPKTHAPPRVRVTWGQGLSFKAIVEGVQQKFTLFNPHGVPLRATVNVTFREYKTLEEQLAELNLQSADHTRRYVVQHGDTLSRIAARQYHDPAEWRRIADANASLVQNPRLLRPGMSLVIPPIDVLHSTTERH